MRPSALSRSIALATSAVVTVASLAGAQVNAVTFLGYPAVVPSSWTVRAPSGQMRLAQFVVPASANAPSAEVIVYFFGEAMKPNVDANRERWRAAFSTPDSSPVPETVSRDSTGQFPITFAEYRGTYRRGMGAGSADSVRTGQTLIASIVETPHGVLFIQLFGPSERVAAERETFIRFVKGVGQPPV